MGSYVESLSNLDQAQGNLDNFLAKKCSYGGFLSNYLPTIMSKCWVFLHATQEDFVGALQIASKLDDLTQIAIVKRLSGDLHRALDELNIQATNLEKRTGSAKNLELTNTLKQRGYVKYLMDDKIGARKDAELAQQMRVMDGEECDPSITFGEDLCDVSKLPLSYLGCSF